MATGRCGNFLLREEEERGERGVKTGGERRKEKVGQDHKPSELTLLDILPQHGSTTQMFPNLPRWPHQMGIKCSHS